MTLTIEGLLRRATREPGRPRLTWYGDDGERVELSGAVLENWVNKTANLLVEEFDIGPGSRVQLDLPPHWRTIVWAFAVWRVGACVVLSSQEASDPLVDVVVTDRPGEATLGPALVAVTLAALARSFPAELPAGAVDAASAVMTYGDVIAWAPPIDPEEPALAAPGAGLTHAALPDWAQTTGPAPAQGERALTTLADDRLAGVAGLLRRALATFDADGSLVCLGPGVTLDAEQRRRLIASERIALDVPGQDVGGSEAG